MESWVTIANLQKKIDDFELGPIDLKIEPGTIMALVGNNGSGKSTLLKLMMHLAKPDSGSIKLFDESINSANKNWKPYVAYLPQTSVGVNTFTGVALKQLTASWYPDWDEELFQYMVQHFDIPLRKKYTKLSPGVQQKLNLALTIARNASFMILDEPTSFLDIPSTKLLGDILTDWMDSGERAIFMTSHQVEDIRKFSDYIAILHNGELLGVHEKGALQERFRRYWLQEHIPAERIPGEISRYGKQMVTENVQKTEQYFKDRNIEWFDEEKIDLEEIITILMNKNKTNN